MPTLAACIPFVSCVPSRNFPDEITHSDGSPVQHKPSLLHKEHGIWFLVRHRHLERRLVSVRIERLADRINLLEAVLLQRAEQDALRHLQPVVEVDEVLVVFYVRAGLFGNGGQRAVEVVDAVDEVFSKLLDGEVAGCFLVALGAVLQIAEVGDGACEFVLYG